MKRKLEQVNGSPSIKDCLSYFPHLFSIETLKNGEKILMIGNACELQSDCVTSDMYCLCGNDFKHEKENYMLYYDFFTENYGNIYAYIMKEYNIFNIALTECDSSSIKLKKLLDHLGKINFILAPIAINLNKIKLPKKICFIADKYEMNSYYRFYKKRVSVLNFFNMKDEPKFMERLYIHFQCSVSLNVLNFVVDGGSSLYLISKIWGDVEHIDYLRLQVDELLFDRNLLLSYKNIVEFYSIDTTGDYSKVNWDSLNRHLSQYVSFPSYMGHIEIVMTITTTTMHFILFMIRLLSTGCIIEKVDIIFISSVEFNKFLTLRNEFFDLLLAGRYFYKETSKFLLNISTSGEIFHSSLLEGDEGLTMNLKRLKEFLFKFNHGCDIVEHTVIKDSKTPSSFFTRKFIKKWKIVLLCLKQLKFGYTIPLLIVDLVYHYFREYLMTAYSFEYRNYVTESTKVV